MNNNLQVSEIDPSELIKELKEEKPFFLLDCREHYEWNQIHLEGSFHIPMNEIPSRLSEIDKDAQIVVICAHGERSRYVAYWLNQQGYNSKSLRGGLAGWPNK